MTGNSNAFTESVMKKTCYVNNKNTNKKIKLKLFVYIENIPYLFLKKNKKIKKNSRDEPNYNRSNCFKIIFRYRNRRYMLM